MDHTAVALAELHVAVSALTKTIERMEMKADLSPVRLALKKAGEALDEVRSGRHVRHGPPMPAW